MKYSKSELISKEVQQRTNFKEILTNTEGFSRLSEKQQAIILQSLYIQQRAERGTDLASLFAIERPGEFVRDSTAIRTETTLRDTHTRGAPDPKTRKYSESQNHIANWHCHSAIYNLELEKGLTEQPPEIPKGFFEANYHTPDTLEELEGILENAEMPQVLHIMTYLADFDEGMHTSHSCLVLGKGRDGKYVVWEKASDTLPYRISTLDAVYQKYQAGNQYWGIRKLRNKGEYQTDKVNTV